MKIGDRVLVIKNREKNAYGDCDYIGCIGEITKIDRSALPVELKIISTNGNHLLRHSEYWTSYDRIRKINNLINLKF